MNTMREGFTMVELLLVMVLGLVLLGAVYDNMTRQEQAFGLFTAVANSQHDARTGMDLLTSEFRELSPSGGDLLMATRDSIRIRALRKFGVICITDKNNKRFGVGRFGATAFAPGDSVVIYVDQDSLKATDDIWQTAQISATGGMLMCGTTLGMSLGVLAPTSKLEQITVAGAGLRFDSIFPGAPIRSFETLTYRVGNINGEPWVQRVRGDTITPLVGPVDPTRGFRVSYFDTLGTELTTFPLSAAQRGSVGRLRLELRARRRTGDHNETYTDSLITDTFVRGT